MLESKVADSFFGTTAVVGVLVISLLAGASGVNVSGFEVGPTVLSSDEDERQQAGCDVGRVYDAKIPSVVTVRVFDSGGDRGQGSGWVYATNGSDLLVVTNYHVIDGAAGADVRFSGGEWRNVRELVGADPYADLALLRVEDAPGYAEALEVSDSLPEQGDEVAALGSPLGLEGTVTKGIVSAVDRSVTVGTGGEMYTVVDAIQIDTPISPGNSGGPLVDCRGEVVGVNFAGVSPLAGQDINFAISATMLGRIVPELVKNGTYDHSYLGIRGGSLSPTIARINGINGTAEGVLVDNVVADGPADADLRGSDATDRVTGVPVGGDVIVAVEGTRIGDVDELRDYLFENTRPGDAIQVTVLRDGERVTVEITLAVRPFPREQAGTQEPTI